MRLLLTALSVLAGWGLLIVLIVGLLLTLKQLDGIRRHLERIAMGVRAIEQQTMPLGEGADALAASLHEAGGTVNAAARRLTDVERNLDAAAPMLRSRG